MTRKALLSVFVAVGAVSARAQNASPTQVAIPGVIAADARVELIKGGLRRTGCDT